MNKQRLYDQVESEIRGKLIAGLDPTISARAIVDPQIPRYIEDEIAFSVPAAWLKDGETIQISISMHSDIAE